MTSASPPSTAPAHPTAARVPSDPAPGPRAPAGAAAPLWAVLVITWMNSLATGIPYNGIWYIAKNVYHFTPLSTYVLGVLLGVTYIAGAMGSGPLIRRLIDRGVVRGARDVLITLAIVMALLTALPVGVFFAYSAEARAAGTGSGGAWAVWVFMGLYSALCGAFWPVVEAFLAGGRTDRQVAAALGKFNITWSSSLIVSLWCLLPFPASGQALALGISGLMHLASLAIMLRLPRRPGDHPHHHGRVPPIYHVLLPVHRVLLPTVYMVMYALSPALPRIIEALGAGARWEPAFGSIWIIARVATFTLLERWQGWHGRWVTATAGTATMLGGFVLAMLAPLVRSPDGSGGELGIALLVIGLLLFGFGAATIYCAALYYGLEVGAAEVEAGGMHEAMIGIGYTLGPASGLLPAWLVASNTLNAEWQHRVMLGLVGVMTAGGVTFAVAVKRRAERLHLPGRNPNDAS